MGGDYMPKVRTASDFCSKYEMIEDAKLRKEKFETNGHKNSKALESRYDNLINGIFSKNRANDD